MPQSSIHDREHLTRLILSDTTVFQGVKGADRDELLRRLLSITGRLTSINTLIQDTLFLDGPARALHQLCPAKFKGSLYQSMRRQWSSIESGQTFEVQISERVFQRKETPSSHFHCCMIQLWLFGIRHLVNNVHLINEARSFGWSSKMLSLVNLATIAQRLGFSSPRIRDLLTENSNQKLARGFVDTVCVDNFFIPEVSMVQDISTSFDAALHCLRDIGPMLMPAFTTENLDDMAHRRFNSPTSEQYSSQRVYLFLEQVFVESPPPGRFPTSLGIVRDILLCFFGSTILSPINTGQPALRSLSDANIQTTSEQRAERQGLLSKDIIPSEVQLENTDQFQNSETRIYDLELQGNIVDPPDNIVDPLYLEECDSPPVSHPPGTPDYAEPESGTTIAPGFEDIRHIGSLNHLNHITHGRKVEEILRTWATSNNETLVVVFLFESRVYYKFLVEDDIYLRKTLKNLTHEHSFMVIDKEYGLITPDMNKIFESALKYQLVFAAKRDHPGPTDKGQMSLDELRNYVQVFDLHTGKRKEHLREKLPPSKRRFSREE